MGSTGSPLLPILVYLHRTCFFFTCCNYRDDNVGASNAQICLGCARIKLKLTRTRENTVLFDGADCFD